MQENKASLDTFRSFIQCIERSASVHEKQKVLTHPFVTISRQMGAGGITVATHLAAYLNTRDKQAAAPWTFFDRELVKLIIEHHNLPEGTAKFIHESKTSEIRDLIESMLNLHPPAFALIRKTSETILHLAQMGHAILIGRGAAVITRKLAGGVHVRLVAPEPVRRKNLEKKHGISSAEASRMIKEGDLARRDYVKQNFDRDVDDPLLYDLVINIEKIPFEQAAVIIGDQVLRMRQKISAPQ